MAHALTLRNDFLREHSNVLTISVLVHLALLALLIFNLNLMPRRVLQPSRLAIQAIVVDTSAIRQRAAEEERRQRQTLDDQRRRREEDMQRQQAEQERRAAEQTKREDQRRAAEQKRKAEKDALRREQVKREQDATKAREAAAAQQKREAAEAQRKTEAQRRQAQTKADLARQLAEEEELAAAADSGELDQYLAVVRQKVQRNWTEPASARPGDSCDVKVQQIPGGEIVSAVAVNCSGDAAFARSVEVAVLRSSPLPPPPNPALFERNLLFNFKPEK